jgi:hypothetical protein
VYVDNSAAELATKSQLKICSINIFQNMENFRYLLTTLTNIMCLYE